MCSKSVNYVKKYLLYTSDLTRLEGTTVVPFADDTATLADWQQKFCRVIDKLYLWRKRWLAKLNECKYVHINFTNKKI